LSSDKVNGLMFGNFKNPNTSNILGHSSISVLKSTILLIIVIYLEIKFIELIKIELTKIEKV